MFLVLKVNHCFTVAFVTDSPIPFSAINRWCSSLKVYTQTDFRSAVWNVCHPALAMSTNTTDAFLMA